MRFCILSTCLLASSLSADPGLEETRALALSGSASSQYELAEMYQLGVGVQSDFTEAARWYRSSAEQGYAKAQYRLGRLYRYGEGLEQDDLLAVHWYVQAAEQGYAAAQNDLGFMFYQGNGVARDYSKAMEWFEKAAGQGLALAQYNLGVMYRDGKGVARDPEMAAKWFEKAARQGLKVAQENLDKLKRDKKSPAKMLAILGTPLALPFTAYLFLQIYVPLKTRGTKQFWVSLMAAPVGLSILWITNLNYQMDSNLWPLVLFFTGPFLLAFEWLVLSSARKHAHGGKN